MKVIKLAPNDGQQISFQSDNQGDHSILFTGNIISIEKIPHGGVNIIYLDPFGNRTACDSFLSLAEWRSVLPDTFITVSDSVIVNLRYVTEYSRTHVTVTYRSRRKHYKRDKWCGKLPLVIDNFNY